MPQCVPCKWEEKKNKPVYQKNKSQQNDKALVTIPKNKTGFKES